MSEGPLNHQSDDPGILQGEAQGLAIFNSHDVTVTQPDPHGLMLIQLALQAVIEASTVVLGEKFPALQLQEISEALGTASETKSVIIDNSDTIVITQTSLQVDAVVQAAIQLLTELSLRVAGAK